GIGAACTGGGRHGPTASPAGSGSARGLGGPGMFTLRSPAFAHDSPIPKRYTADGEALSPPLSWTEVPEGTRSFALVVDDPDAPDPANPKRTYVHWVVYNLPASCTELPADAARHLPQGAKH